MDGINLPKAVFFDWDGTLVDSFAFLHKTHNHVRGKFDMPPFTTEDFGQHFGMPREQLYAEIYGVDNVEEAKGHFEAFVIANHHEIKMIDGAKAILDVLAAMDIPMGVVTNKKGSLVRKEISNHGWDDYFVSVVGAGEASDDKPSPAPLILALEKSGLDASFDDLWYVGDTISDLKCGDAADAKNVFIENDEDKSDLIAEYQPFLSFKNCQEFADFLLQSDVNSLQQETKKA